MWKTEVTNVERYPYFSKSEIYLNHPYEDNKKYFDRKKKEMGFFLGYKIKVLESVDVDKPKVKMARIGWLKLDAVNKKVWFNDNKLDDNANPIEKSKTLSLLERLIEINAKMQAVSPRRAKKLVNTLIRNDLAFIRLLKEAANHKCQYPECGHQIQTRDNGFYIEVSHIAPVKSGGQSVLGNLIVLCPNHHKEFDYGNREIIEQSPFRLLGKLNGKHFEIKFDYK